MHEANLKCHLATLINDKYTLNKKAMLVCDIANISWHGLQYFQDGRICLPTYTGSGPMPPWVPLVTKSASFVRGDKCAACFNPPTTPASPPPCKDAGWVTVGSNLYPSPVVVCDVFVTGWEKDSSSFSFILYSVKVRHAVNFITVQ